MLVLARKAGDSIRIGDDIIVTVLCVGNNGIRIGIDAPPEVKILRTEIVDHDELRDAFGNESTHG